MSTDASDKFDFFANIKLNQMFVTGTRKPMQRLTFQSTALQFVYVTSAIDHNRWSISQHRCTQDICKLATTFVDKGYPPLSWQTDRWNNTAGRTTFRQCTHVNNKPRLGRQSTSVSIATKFINLKTWSITLQQNQILPKCTILQYIVLLLTVPVFCNSISGGSFWRTALQVGDNNQTKYENVVSVACHLLSVPVTSAYTPPFTVTRSHTVHLSLSPVISGHQHLMHK